jgi:hypothetical protein
MRKSLILLSLVLFSLPLYAGRDVSALRYAPSDVSTEWPVIAENGTHFLTLWAVSNSHIFASLSNAANSPAFAAVPFASASGLAVVGTGSGYAAIWNERDSVPILGRFTSEGVLERRIPLARNRFSGSRLAFNGSEIAIVDANGSSIDISLYDLDGNLVRRSPVINFSDETYALTASGGDFVVVTAGVTGINEWRVTNDGAVQPAIRIQPPPSDALRRTYAIAVAAKNGLIVTGWVESRWGELSGTLASATIQPDGTVKQRSLLTGSGPPGGGLAILPVDRGYVMVWSVSPFAPAIPGVFALLLDDSGAAVDQPSLLRGDGHFTAAASIGNTIKFVFGTFTSSGQMTLTATVDATGITTRAPESILAAVRQLGPAVAPNGAGFTAAWLEREAGAKRIVAARINAAGEPLDGTGIPLDLHASSAPVIAHGPSEELIVWIGNGRLKATRLSPFSGVLDATPIDIAPLPSGSYDVVWNGSQFFVVWTDGTKFSGAFVGPDGVATSPKDIRVQNDIASALDLAFNGRQYILVYAEESPLNCTCIPYPDRVRIMSISAAGAVTDSVSVQTLGRPAAHVASSGSESLVVFDRDRGPSSVVVRDEGGILHLDPEVPLLNWFVGTSAVAWDGSSYVVAVRYSLSPAFTTDPGWLAAIQVSQSGVPLRTVTTAAAGPPDFALETAPSIATDVAAGTAFVISEVAPPVYVARARLYFMSQFSTTAMPAPPPAPRNAVSYFSGTTARIDWQSEDGANGFLIEQSIDFGKNWFRYAVVAADARTTIVNAKVGDQFRIRAFGTGGLSDGTVTSIGSMQRRRAERH